MHCENRASSEPLRRHRLLTLTHDSVDLGHHALAVLARAPVSNISEDPTRIEPVTMVVRRVSV
jgi:hypothetical protein